jgi:hypothetical protein
MCEECEGFPVRYVAYFNKPGGKLWRPAHKVTQRPWAIDIVPAEPVATPREFVCVEVSATTAPIALSPVADVTSPDHEFVCEPTCRE